METNYLRKQIANITKAFFVFVIISTLWLLHDSVYYISGVSICFFSIPIVLWVIIKIKRHSSYSTNSNFFDAGGYLELKVSIVDDTTATIYFTTYNESNVLQNAFSHNVTRLTSDEIASEDAVLAVKVGTDTTSCTLFVA